MPETVGFTDRQQLAYARARAHPSPVMRDRAARIQQQLDVLVDVLDREDTEAANAETIAALMAQLADVHSQLEAVTVERDQLLAAGIRKGKLPPTEDARCGTPAGYQAHGTRHEDACAPCRAANAAYNAEYRARKAAGQTLPGASAARQAPALAPKTPDVPTGTPVPVARPAPPPEPPREPRADPKGLLCECSHAVRRHDDDGCAVASCYCARTREEAA